jgi:sensor histidine kinase YesM
MKKYFIHNPFFRLLAPVVYGILIYLLILLINNTITQINEFFSSQEVYICMALSYLSFESNRLVIVLLDKFLKGKYLLLRIPVQLIFSTIISTMLVVISISLYFIYALGFSMAGTQLLVFGIIYLVTSLLYNVMYFSNDYLQRENTLKLTAEKQQREVLEMEMAEFRNDINPDLLYESLENVISLMNRKNDQAEEYIDYLASAYRYVLTNRQRELISLRVEVDAAQNIIRLLNERYFGQLKLDIALQEEDLALQLIPGSLPIALECIVRNTIISNQEPLTIKCYLEDDEYLVIQSRLNDRLIQHSESAMALTRLQKSYTLYSDRPLIQVKAYEENYIKLPVLRITEEALTHA